MYVYVCVYVCVCAYAGSDVKRNEVADTHGRHRTYLQAKDIAIPMVQLAQ
jgi:hypothetical protein